MYRRNDLTLIGGFGDKGQFYVISTSTLFTSNKITSDIKQKVYTHEYLVREQVDEELFKKLVIHIRENGYEGRFYSKKITYYEEEGMVYRTKGAPIEKTTIINRWKKEDSFEYRKKKGTLPKIG